MKKEKDYEPRIQELTGEGQRLTGILTQLQNEYESKKQQITTRIIEINGIIKEYEGGKKV